MTDAALTLRQHGVVALVVSAMLEDRGAIRPNACRLAAQCADVGPRLIAAEIEALVALGVLTQGEDGRIAEPDALAAIERQARIRAANATNAALAAAARAEKAKRINGRHPATDVANREIEGVGAFAVRIARAIGVDLDDPEVAAAWSSVAGRGIVRHWRSWGLSDDAIIAEAKDAAAALLERLGPRGIDHPARLDPWMARAARGAAAPVE